MPEAQLQNSGSGLAPATDGWFVVTRLQCLGRDPEMTVAAEPDRLELASFDRAQDRRRVAADATSGGPRR